MSQPAQITPQQAIQYLINAVQVGQKRGTWNLQEASTLQAAVEAAQKIRFLEPQQLNQVPQQTAPQPVQQVQPKVAMSAQRVSPSKLAKPSLPPVPEEPPQTVEKQDIQQVVVPQKSVAPQKPVQSQPINLNKPLTAAKAAQIHKISQNLKNLQEVIKQNHQPRQQLTPQILGLDGPVGPEVTITQGPVKA
jgi:hypothetical protein